MIVIYAVLLLYATWIMYLGIMNLKRAKDAGTISKLSLYLGYFALFVGAAMDVATNIVMSIPLLEPPRELLLARRLRRLKHGDYGWRTKAAKRICSTLLDVFDPSGDHCN